MFNLNIFSYFINIYNNNNFFILLILYFILFCEVIIVINIFLENKYHTLLINDLNIDKDDILSQFISIIIIYITSFFSICCTSLIIKTIFFDEKHKKDIYSH